MLKLTFAFLLFTFELLAQNNADTVVIIKNVTVWDGLSDAAIPNSQVLIVQNLIKEVGLTVTDRKDAKIIDGKGRFLMPGLTDAHLHLMLNVSMSSANNSAHFGIFAVGYSTPNFFDKVLDNQNL